MQFNNVSVHHGYGYGYHKREAEADAHGYAYEKVTKTICKKTPITEEVSKDFELCRPKPSEVCLSSIHWQWQEGINTNSIFPLIIGL